MTNKAPKEITLTNFGGTVYGGASTWYTDGGETPYTDWRCLTSPVQSETVFAEDTELEITLHVTSDAQLFHCWSIADTVNKIDVYNTKCVFTYAQYVEETWKREEATYTLHRTVHAGNYLYIATWFADTADATEITVKRI